MRFDDQGVERPETGTIRLQPIDPDRPALGAHVRAAIDDGQSFALPRRNAALRFSGRSVRLSLRKLFF